MSIPSDVTVQVTLQGRPSQVFATPGLLSAAYAAIMAVQANAAEIAAGVEADRAEVEANKNLVAADKDLVDADKQTVVEKALEVEAARAEVETNRTLVAANLQSATDRAEEAETAAFATSEDRVQTGIDRANAAGSAANAAASEQLAASNVLNAGYNRDTLAQLNAVVSPPTNALGAVIADGANNGTYRFNGSTWSRISTATVVTFGSAISRSPRHGQSAFLPLCFVNASSSRWSPIWLTGAGQVDLVPSASLITKITGSLSAQINLSATVTNRFEVGARRHGLNLPFVITANTGGARWAALWIDESGRVDMVPSDTLLRRLGAAASVPSGVFAGSALAAPTLQWLSSADEGFPARYAVRGDLSAPVTAVPASRDRALLFTMTGQSNAVMGGNTDFPEGSRSVTTAAPYRHRALTFNGGPVFTSLGTIPASSITDLVRCAETATGESPITSALRWSVARDLAANAAPLIRIGETHGYAGQRLIEVSKGTAPYTNGLTLWKRAAELAFAYDLPGLWCPAVLLDQGEADRSGTSRGTWSSQFATFRADHEADLRAITRQPEPVWFILAQLASAPGSTTDATGAWTALSQWDVMRNGLRATLGFPSYFFQGAYGMSGVHFTPTGHALRGEYHAKAHRIIRRAIEAAARDGVDPWSLTIASIRACLRPDTANVARAGAVITIPLILPADGTAVVLDTSTLPAATNFGFVKTAGAGGAISNVALVGNAIQVTLDAPGGATLRYAYDNITFPRPSDRSSAWGNFRDDCDEDSIAVPGLKLRNWLVTFDVTVA